MNARAGNRGRTALIAAVLVVALGGLALWWTQTFERKEVEIPLPPRGEAAFNPLYALKRALQIDGLQVHSRRRLALGTQALGATDTLLILGDQRSLPQRDAQRLLDWVHGGGHLVVELPAAGASERAQSQGPLLETLGVSVKPIPRECAQYRDAAKRDADASLMVCSDALILVEEDRDVAAHWHDNDYNADVLVRLPHGKGSVDVVASLDFLQGKGLENANAAALARQLLAPNYGRGSMHLVYQADVPPLWRIVLERGWMAWLPLLLALAGWLWWRMQRRGPLLPSPVPARRSLVEHVRASGEHVHRYGRGYLLHAALRELFEARLRRRDPYAASLQGEAQRHAIAARTGVPDTEVDAALRAPVPFVAADLRLRIAKLNKLRLRL